MESRGWCGSIRYFIRCSDSIDPPHLGLLARRNGPMQITTDTEVLETIMTHATAARCLARRLTDASDRAIVIDALTASLDEITVPLAQLLGRPHARHWRAARSPSRAA